MTQYCGERDDANGSVLDVIGLFTIMLTDCWTRFVEVTNMRHSETNRLQLRSFYGMLPKLY